MIAILIVSLLSVSCSGGGGEGGGGGGTPPQVVMLTGLVQAPAGQLAELERPSLFGSLTEFLIPRAQAMISGLLPVADGTEVELIRVNDSGGVDQVLATTRTTSGRYSFNLTDLGLNPASNLAVQVAGPGVGMRAFVSDTETDLNPVSEAVARLVFESIASTANRFLSDFTTSELEDLYQGADLLTSLDSTLPSTGIENSVTGIVAALRNDSGFMAYLSTSAGTGQTNVGMGDLGNLDPLAVGDTWNYQVVASDQPAPYTNQIEVIGTKQISGTTVKVIRESNTYNSGQPTDEFIEKNDKGVINWGNTDSEDIVTPEIAPYTEVSFPITLGRSEELVNRSGLPWRKDVDGDGRKETFSARATLTHSEVEAVSLPIGDFARILRSETQINLDVTLSMSGDVVTTTDQLTEWHAPGVGLVKSEDSITTLGPSGTTVTTTETMTLKGYRVGGVGRGILAPFTIADSLATANSDTEFPGQAAVGTDGRNFLVVTCREPGQGSQDGIIGLIVSSTGEVSPPFHIANHTCLGFHADIAFDGTNYLLIYTRTVGLFGVRISADGTVIDTNDGFPVSSGPETTSPGGVAFDGTNYLVVYGKFMLNTGNLWDIYASQISQSGQVLGEFPVDSAPGDQLDPAIAFDGQNYLVVWADTPTGAAPSPDTDLRAARVSQAGTVLDPSGFAITVMPNPQSGAKVAFDGTNYLVVWQDWDLSAQMSRVFGRRLKTDGTLLDGTADSPGVAINNTLQTRGGLTLTFDGKNYLVAWSLAYFNNDPSAGIFAARLSAAGVLLDGPADSTGLSISGLPPDASRFVHPTLSFNGTSSLLIWNDNIETTGQLKSLRGAQIYPF